ncbi:MAG: hypothetical protein LUQ09_02415 [Methanomassiliicoccales archaeon]|nr:hypothetical protein [Methanomassiliicoccales archaeon]
MKYDTGKFEGGYRLSHIHQTKRYMFLLQVVIMLAFAIYLLVAGGDFEMKPFYLGINSFLYFVLVMVLLIMVEGFIFIVLEMRFVRSDGTKFIITQRAFRTSATLATVFLIVMLLFWLPIVPAAVESGTQWGKSVETDSTTEPTVISFFNSDALGLTEIDTIDIVAYGEVDVFILTEYNYVLFQDDGKSVIGGYRLNHDEYRANTELTLDFPDLSHGQFYLLVYNMNEDSNVVVDITVNNRVSDSMMNYLPLLCLVFFIANAVWAVSMFFDNKRYKRGGIYR